MPLLVNAMFMCSPVGLQYPRRHYSHACSWERCPMLNSQEMNPDLPAATQHYLFMSQDKCKIGASLQKCKQSYYFRDLGSREGQKQPQLLGLNMTFKSLILILDRPKFDTMLKYN